MESRIVKIDGCEYFLNDRGELGTLRISRYGKYADLKALNLNCVNNTEVYYITDWYLLSDSQRAEFGCQVVMYDADTNSWLPQGVNS